jgi:TRAP-type C4-dicarboxylate transport system permease small subunit
MSMLLSALRGIWQAKIVLQRVFVTLTGLILALMICVQVVARYFFNTAIFGIEEVACYLAIWLYFIGAALGAEQREHMSASLVDVMLRNETAKKVLKVFTCIVSVVLAAWMTVWSYELAAWSIEFGMMSTEINLPVGIAQAAMPIGLGLMTLYFVVELIEHIVFWKRSPAHA